MKIVIAPDSYKESLSAQDAAQAISIGFQKVMPEADLYSCPMGDGGEGTLSALVAATGASTRISEVFNPLGKKTSATWGWNSATKTAFIELAEACGLQKIKKNERSALHATSFGLGQLFLNALDIGAKDIIVFLGGSATNDAGSGMLTALGARLLDCDGNPVPPGGIGLRDLHFLDLSGLDVRLDEVNISAAVDVENPLLGLNGASLVFGPQKGISEEKEIVILDEALSRYARKVNESRSSDYTNLSGAGAAGGLGFTLASVLRADLVPGIELAMHLTDFENIINKADLVITGEGKLDGQSMFGKTPVGIARCAKRHGVPVVVIAGSLDDGWQVTYQEGVTAAFSLVDRILDLDESISRSCKMLEDRSESIARLVKSLSQS